MKRPIHVRLRHFPGLGSHIYLIVKPEPREGDEEPEERTMKFNRRDTARRWVEHLFETEYDRDLDYLRWDSDDTRRWFYPEGD